MARPPSAEATLHPSFGAIGEARQAAIAARSTFFDERIRDGFSGLLWTAGTACTRWCRHAATAHARSCQAEIAADTPLPPTLGSNFWDTALGDAEVDGNRAEAATPVADVAQPRLLHEARQLVRRDEALDRLRQVGIGGAVAGDE